MPVPLQDGVVRAFGLSDGSEAAAFRASPDGVTVRRGGCASVSPPTAPFATWVEESHSADVT